MSNSIAGWYIIYTRPHHEKRVALQLTKKKIRNFLPISRRKRTSRNRTTYVYVPVFPSYIFVFLNSLDEYYEGLHIDGAISYVRSGKKVAKVNEAVIRNIQILTGQTNGWIEVSSASFSSGRNVILNEGPMTGLTGEMIEVEGQNKVLIRVDTLHQNIIVTLPESGV